MQSGLEILLDTIKFDHLTKRADLIITVEGKTDNQSPLGKVVSGVGKRAKTQGIPAVVISGALEPGFEALYDQGIVAAFAACNNTLGLEWQMKNAAMLLEIQVKNMMGILMSFIVGENFRFVLDSYTMGYFIIKASSKYTYVRKKC
jgi:glycerate kinase